MFVLDTNHVSELTYRTAAGLRLLQKLETADQDAAVTAITVEKSLRRWLAEIRRRTDPRTQIAAYQRLTRQVEVFASGTGAFCVSRDFGARTGMNVRIWLIVSGSSTVWDEAQTCL
jgi:predicted nucleic acid-binding protein